MAKGPLLRRFTAPLCRVCEPIIVSRPAGAPGDAQIRPPALALSPLIVSRNLPELPAMRRALALALLLASAALAELTLKEVSTPAQVVLPADDI